jgi:adenylate kinase
MGSSSHGTGRRIRRGPVALTGTPGTGKTAVAQALGSAWRSVEVGDWACSLGAARTIPGGFEVDLPRLRRLWRRPENRPEADLLVGHLAHLLPVRDVVVLRCHPEELIRRLRVARRGTPAERRENFTAEAIDVVLLEALRPGRRIWEFDTTGRSVRAIARQVARRLARRGPSDYGHTDWLSDAAVTEHILAPSG